MEKTTKKDWNWNNVSQYKIDKFTEAWATLYVLNAVSKYKKVFNHFDRQLFTGYLKQYHDYYLRICCNDPNLCKILKEETREAVIEEIEEIYKMGVS